MFCPHCNNNIPDGSNICPLCYGNIAGVRTQSAQEQVHPEADEPQVKKAKPKAKQGKKPAYTKGSRGTKKNTDKAPMIIAIGLILILIIIIAMIVMSMFGAGGDTNIVNPGNTQTQQTPVKQTPDVNLIVFGATPTPQTYVQVTPTPRIEVTPTPTPVPAVSYSTLRKGDEGPDVVTMQLALTELGYLSGASDGNFGTGTMNAVKKFQQDNGLDADGIAGKLTLEVLYAKSSVTPMPDSTPDVRPGDILDLPG
ncbi:MAG: peptidoglycan-binding protein [Clostridia bacterium]|nr:peptidoglycan-binding protein [Clostridia bacterium]